MGSSVYIEQPRYIAHVEPPACHVASVQEGPRFVAEVTGPASFAVVARGIVMLPGASSINDIAGLAEALAGKQPAGSYALAGHGHGISDVTGLGEALAGKQAVIPSLATTARLALPATLQVGQRDVLVWDTIWQCYFRYVEATASWQQVSVPRHDNTTMNSLPNPEAGYRVFNTTWGVESTYTGAFWQELRRVVKQVSESRANTATVTSDQELSIFLTPGVWQLAGGIYSTGDIGIRFQIVTPEIANNTGRKINITQGNGINSFTHPAPLVTNQLTVAGITSTVSHMWGTLEVLSSGLFRLFWAQNTANETATTILKASYFEFIRIA